MLIRRRAQTAIAMLTAATAILGCGDSGSNANPAAASGGAGGSNASSGGGDSGGSSPMDPQTPDPSGGSSGATTEAPAAGGQGGTAGASPDGAGGANSAGGEAADGGAAGADATGGDAGSGGMTESKSELSFFVTSSNPDGMGGDLGGLEGADAFCQLLAEAVGAGDRDWKAYLSTDEVNARDRIGAGPWTNSDGVVIATDVENLHSDSNNITKATAVTESGEVINGRGDQPNQHDIMTGTNADGTAAENNCSNWTSNTDEHTTMLGHHDRMGLDETPPSLSWNASHDSNGCSLFALTATGGDGRFYCFAADPPN